MNSFVLKGQICTSASMDEIEITENGFLVVEDGIVRGVFRTLPSRFAELPLQDCGGCLIVPGMTDLHVHAPQFAFREGYEADIVVLDDSTLDHPQELSVRARLERFVYLADERCIRERYVAGEKVL